MKESTMSMWLRVIVVKLNSTMDNIVLYYLCADRVLERGTEMHVQKRRQSGC